MTSPAARQALLVGQVLEDVLLKMTKLRRKIDRSNPVMKIESALEALRALADSEPADVEHMDLLEAALGATRQARIAFDDNDPSEESAPLRKRLFAAQRALEHVRAGTIDAVVAVQDQAKSSVLRRTADPTPFLASVGEPRLRRFSRAVLATGVEVVAPDDWVFDEVETNPREAKVGDRIASDDDGPDPDLGAEADFVASPSDEPDDAKRLQMFVPIGKNPVMTPGLEGEVAQLERIATQCLEDIGVLGNLRQVKEETVFVIDAIERFEQRMLSNVDAALALGTAFEVGASVGGRFTGWPILDHAIEWAKDAAVPDPGRAFARTLLLCSVDGKDTLRAALLALKLSHPLTYPMHAQAFALAPNPAINQAMVDLCNDDDPRICAMAAEVLAMRGYGDAAQLLLLLEHSNHDVRLAAAHCAAVAGAPSSRQAAITTLTAFVESELDDDVSLAAIESLVLLGSANGLVLARERIRADIEEPGYLQRATCDRLLQLIAVAGDASDWELLL